MSPFRLPERIRAARVAAWRWWRAPPQEADVTRESAGAWSEAGRNLLRQRRELRALRAERSQAQFALGGAAYREDEVEVATLRVRLRELDDAIAERERAAAEMLDRARRRVARERLAIQPIQQLAPADEDARVHDQAEASEQVEAEAASTSAEASAKREKSNRKQRQPAGGRDGTAND